LVVDPDSAAGQPFSPAGAPVELRAKARRLTAWQIVDDSAGPLPVSPVTAGARQPEESITLIPAFPYTLPAAGQR
jgi:hypothetical protein